MSTNRTFNPNDHLVDIKGKKYLPVAYRLVWLRVDNPKWGIKTELVERGDSWAIMKAQILNEDGKIIAEAHKTETKQGFADYLEKAETGAVGRALAMCGYGTQFSPDFDEGERLADSPLEDEKPVSGEKMASEAQIKAMRAIYADKKANITAMKALLKSKHGVTSHKDLTMKQASEWITFIKGMDSTTTGKEDIDPNELDFTAKGL